MLVLAALCLPLAVALWQLGRVTAQRDVLAYKREKAAKDLEAIRVEAAGDIERREKALSELTRLQNQWRDEVHTRLSRLEQGRELVNLKRGA